MNTFGSLFRLTTFGESHGPAMGSLIDGCPAGIPLDVERIQRALDRRRPGQSSLTTARSEADRVEVLSGLYEGKTLGTPIAAVVRNTDQRSEDYTTLARVDRPGHADRVWRERFQHRDPRGGGRTSGRETLCRVIGGAVAESLLAVEAPALSIVAWVAQVGALKFEPEGPFTRAQVDVHPSRCPDAGVASQIEASIADAKSRGDSLGGVITVRIDGAPVGWGEPVFGKLKARLADAFAGIGAVTGVLWGPLDLATRLTHFGAQFHATRADGVPSEVYGGIQGGLSNGAPIVAQVLFKPPATLADHAKAGRHDPCILPRAVPVVEAMAALVMADLCLSVHARPHRS